MYASELKDTLTRLRPDFDERAYGCPPSATHGAGGGPQRELKVWTEESSLKIGLNGKRRGPRPQLNKENWINAFREYLNQYKADGFDRITRRFIKAAIRRITRTSTKRPSAQALQRHHERLRRRSY